MSTSETQEKTSLAGNRSRSWSGRTRGGIVGNWIFMTLVRYGGLRCAYLLLIPVAFYFLFFAPKASKASRQFLQRVAYPCRGRLGMAWVVWRHFFSFGQTLLDRTSVLAGGAGQLHFAFDGEEHIRKAIGAGKGVIVVGSHFGNWEVASDLLGGTETPVNIVSLKAEVVHIQRYFDRVLQGRGFALIEAGQSEQTGLAILTALRRGEIVVMQGDRAIGKNDAPVPFLGAEARFPVGPYIMAALSGAALLHTFGIRQKRFHYLFKAYPPEFLAFGPRSKRAEQCRAWATCFAARLEEHVRRYPLQWYNFYDFWADGTAQEKRAAS